MSLYPDAQLGTPYSGAVTAPQSPRMVTSQSFGGGTAPAENNGMWGAGSTPSPSMAPQSGGGLAPSAPTPAYASGGGVMPPFDSMTEYQGHFAHGGGVQTGGRAKHMIEAHMNPQELDALDWIQGKRIHHGKTGRRMYPGIEALIKNPHIRAHVFEMAQGEGREHHASGGGVYGGLAPVEASHGMHGDSEIGLLGPHTVRFFNSLRPPHPNPIDGAPQYWSLSGIIGSLANKVGNIGSSIWNTGKGYLAPVAKAVLPTLGNVAGEVGTKYLGPIGGSLATGLTNSLGNEAINHLPQANDDALSQYLAAGAQGAAETAHQHGLGTVNSYKDLVPGMGGGTTFADRTFNRAQDIYQQNQAQQPQSPGSSSGITLRPPQAPIATPQTQTPQPQQAPARAGSNFTPQMRQELLNRMRQRATSLNQANTVQGNVPTMNHGGQVHHGQRNMMGY